MYLRLDEDKQIARLMGFLWAGECVAANIAEQQVHLAPDIRARQFLARQARQERFHADVFARAQRWLDRGRSGSASILAPMVQYESLAEASLARADFDESLIALQVILEGLGHVVLTNIDAGLSRRGLGFARLRRQLRQQEQAHHAFGAHLLNRRIESGVVDPKDLRSCAGSYLELVDVMLTELADLFVGFDEDPAQYRAAFERTLPSWLRPS